MGIGHEDAKRLTLWEFDALRYEWSERHKSDADEPMPLPDEDFVRARQAELVELGIAGTKH